MSAERDLLAEKELEIKRLKAFLHVSRLMNAQTNPAKLVQQINQELPRFLDADRCTVFFHDRATDELCSFVASGLESSEIRIPTTQGLAGAVYQSGEVICLDDAYTDDRFNPEVDRRTGYRTKSVLAVPITNRHGDRIGVVQVLNKQTGPFDESDREFLGELVVQVSDLVDLVLRKEELARQHEALKEAFSHLKVYDYLLGEKTVMKSVMRKSRWLHIWVSIVGAVFIAVVAVTGVLIPFVAPHWQSFVYQLHSGKLFLKGGASVYTVVMGVSLTLLTVTGIMLWAYPRFSRWMRHRLEQKTAADGLT